MWLLFVPFLFIVAVLFVLGSLVAGVVGLLGAAWPIVLIGLGAWLLWHDDGRHRHVWRGRRQHRFQGRSDTFVASTLTDAHERRSRKESAQQPPEPSELPIDVQVKVEQIRRKVDVLLGHVDRFPPFSQDLYLVRQTASEYLPRTINTYLSMRRSSPQPPFAGADVPALCELKSQLDLLDARLDEIARDLQRQDTDRLLANRRFLEDRFGTRDARRSATTDPSVSSPSASVVA